MGDRPELAVSRLLTPFVSFLPIWRVRQDWRWGMALTRSGGLTVAPRAAECGLLRLIVLQGNGANLRFVFYFSIP
jgi:hypothetical protein